MKYCSLLLIILIIYLTYDYCTNINEPFVSTQYDESGDRLLGDGTGYDDSEESMFAFSTFSMGAVCPENSGITTLTNFNGNQTNCDYQPIKCQTLADGESLYDWNYGNTDDSKRKECQKCVRGSDNTPTIDSILSNAYIIGNKPTETAPNTYSNFTDYSGYICDSMVACGGADTMYAFNQTDWTTDCGSGTFDATDTDSTLNSLRCVLVSNFFIKWIGSYLGGLTCNLEIQAIKMANKVEDEFKTALGGVVSGVGAAVAAAIPGYGNDDD
jgi:hypothetical protein